MATELIAGRCIRSIDPATGEPIGETPVTLMPEIPRVVSLAQVAQGMWKSLTLTQRLSYIQNFRALLASEADRLAELVTKETGKPLAESFGGEVFPALETCRWLHENAYSVLENEPVGLNWLFFRGKRAYNVFEPLGVIAIISPWNFPFSIPVCSALNALAAGNTVIIKPSPKTPMVGVEIVKLFERAGFPKGVVNVVVGDKDEAICLMRSGVDRVVFTGGVNGGKAIARDCADKLIPVTLELGGKHAAIVLADADIEKTARGLVFGAFTNAGQACASIERAYVERPIFDALSKRVAELTRELRLGHGMSASTDVGPMIDADQVARVTEQLEDAISQGAVAIAGGAARSDLGSCYFQPTVLVNVSHTMRIMREETFGPVLPLMPVDNADEAIAHANDSDLGLGSSIWTRNHQEAERLARKVRAGMVWINDGLYSHASPEAPWGGIKNSGIGRRNSVHGLYDFVYIKHVSVDKSRNRDWHFPYSKSSLSLLKSGIALGHSPSGFARCWAAIKLLPLWLASKLARRRLSPKPKSGKPAPEKQSNA